MRKYAIYIFLILLSKIAHGQKTDVLELSEYLGYVKKYHPVVRKANLLLNEGEAKLLKARGAFDPKLEVDYDQKQFKQADYYSKLNTSFRIPTWYGVEVQGNFENNSGEYLNPEINVPASGLYSAGVSVPLARNLLINERMATLKQAKLYEQQAEADNQLLVNKILYDASLVYFQWLKAYQKKQIYEEFSSNAKLRFEAVKRSYETGDKPAIDTTEARILYKSRILSLEKARLDYIKSTLELSNYLWIKDVPVVIRDSIFPDLNTVNQVDNALRVEMDSSYTNLMNHPLLTSLDLQSKGLDIEKRLKKNNLLPKIDLQYNFLSETPETITAFNTNNYKAGITLNFPLFLRTERAALRLAEYKLQAIEFDRKSASLSLANRLSSIQQEIISYENQIGIVNTIISDYSVLLKAEERKFQIGESSLFLVNSRESKLIENKLKAIEMENLMLTTKGKLFNTLGAVFG